MKLYNLVRKLFDIPEGPRFPCSLANLLRNRSLLTTLRPKLGQVNHLSELIADPPAILIDERQKLFFYRGVPVLLRPASFSYMLLLAQTHGELVMREIIYRCLWPGEINYEGTNKPYERQITDQKRKLLDDIRKGVALRYLNSQCPIMHPSTDWSVFAGFLEVEGWVRPSMNQDLKAARSPRLSCLMLCLSISICDTVISHLSFSERQPGSFQ